MPQKTFTSRYERDKYIVRLSDQGYRVYKGGIGENKRGDLTYPISWNTKQTKTNPGSEWRIGVPAYAGFHYDAFSVYSNGSSADAKRKALVHYNKSRRAAQLSPVKKFPAGTKMRWFSGGKHHGMNPGSKIGTKLTPVRFTVRGKTLTGKAKRVGTKIKIFVTPQVARKVNPSTGKWYMPFRRNRVNYENVGKLPFLLQHDIGFSGKKIYRPVRVSEGGFTLKGNYGMSRKDALDWIKANS